MDTKKAVDFEVQLLCRLERERSALNMNNSGNPYLYNATLSSLLLYIVFLGCAPAKNSFCKGLRTWWC